MIDFSLPPTDAVLPVQMPSDLMPSVGQFPEPTAPGSVPPTKFIATDVETMPHAGQTTDPNAPGVPPPTK
jgi:hypothetical protein